MTELSPATKKVLDATGRKIWYRNDDIAAALRAAAEQIVLPKYQYADWEMADLIMQEIQAIADELEDQ